ncbi:hypothetical protein [Fodinicola acaciae]|uniref:hypothetical protein n=1 Tax=Fodinicola acaciae TaxID=2681555 RepID=UPI0013D3B39C|nr:hypothetical protein [Fodinicola acaciae]
MGGYAARTGPSTGTMDGLELHAVSFSVAERRFLWLVGDLPAVNTDLADAVAARLSTLPGVAPELVWLGATHTHSGPETGCQPGGGATPSPLLSSLVEAAFDAAAAAIEAEEDGSLTVHSGQLDGVAGQRSGVSPRQSVPVTALAFRLPDGHLRGLLAILPVHPTVLGADNRLLSADLAGSVRRALTTDWAMVATGAAGDVSTRPHRHEQTQAELARLGSVAAAQILDLVDTPSSTLDIGDARGSRTPDFALPSRVAEDGPDLAAIRSRFDAVRSSGDAVAIREAETAVQGAELSAKARTADPRLAISAVRLGPLRLVGFGGEPYLALEKQLADALSGPVALVGYTQGYLGYLPTRDAYDTDVYEVNISPVAAGAAELAVAEAVRLARQLD